MSPETPSLIDNFPPNTLLAALQELLPQTTSWDVATGTFDIGSLLALGELWQPIKPLRILMGDETTRRTRKKLLDATSRQADDRIEIAKEEDDFPTMTGLEAIRQALTSKQIQARIYHRLPGCALTPRLKEVCKYEGFCYRCFNLQRMLLLPGRLQGRACCQRLVALCQASAGHRAVLAEAERVCQGNCAQG